MLRRFSVAAVLTLLGCGARSTSLDAPGSAEPGSAEPGSAEPGDDDSAAMQEDPAREGPAQAGTAQAQAEEVQGQLPAQVGDPNLGGTPQQVEQQGSTEAEDSTATQDADQGELIDLSDLEPDEGEEDCVRLFCDGTELHESRSCFERSTRFLETCEFGCVDSVDDAHCASEPRADAGAATPDGEADAFVPSEQVGSVAKSCGSVNLDDGVEVETRLVDCTAFGDDMATCVFSNHCWCSEGFHCEGSEPNLDAGARPECAYGVTCVSN